MSSQPSLPQNREEAREQYYGRIAAALEGMPPTSNGFFAITQFRVPDIETAQNVIQSVQAALEQTSDDINAKFYGFDNPQDLAAVELPTIGPALLVLNQADTLEKLNEDLAYLVPPLFESGICQYPGQVTIAAYTHPAHKW